MQNLKIEMKKTSITKISSLGVVALLIASGLFGGNGNNPNSGSGGNCANNGSGNTIWIYHHHGNGTWSMEQVPPGSLQGHAAHGDMWYQTGCPLTGPIDACL